MHTRRLRQLPRCSYDTPLDAVPWLNACCVCSSLNGRRMTSNLTGNGSLTRADAVARTSAKGHIAAIGAHALQQGHAAQGPVWPQARPTLRSEALCILPGASVAM